MNSLRDVRRAERRKLTRVGLCVGVVLALTLFGLILVNLKPGVRRGYSPLPGVQQGMLSNRGPVVFVW